MVPDVPVVPNVLGQSSRLLLRAFKVFKVKEGARREATVPNVPVVFNRSTCLVQDGQYESDSLRLENTMSWDENPEAAET